MYIEVSFKMMLTLGNIKQQSKGQKIITKKNEILV